MKPQHTAALALVGWYLMVPSMNYLAEQKTWMFGDYAKNGEPELSTWRTMGSYDSAAECERAKKALSLSVPDDVTVDRDSYARQLPRVKQDAVCVGADDPRLKGN